MIPYLALLNITPLSCSTLPIATSWRLNWNRRPRRRNCQYLETFAEFWWRTDRPTERACYWGEWTAGKRLGAAAERGVGHGFHFLTCSVWCHAYLRVVCLGDSAHDGFDSRDLTCVDEHEANHHFLHTQHIFTLSFFFFHPLLLSLSSSPGCHIRHVFDTGLGNNKAVKKERQQAQRLNY